MAVWHIGDRERLCGQFFQMDERILEKKINKQLEENLSLLKDPLEAGMGASGFVV